MKLKVLGSSGSEVAGHNPPAFLIDEFLLLDAGTVAISLDRDAQCKITHIFLTHAHFDHIKGIPFLVDNIVLSRQGCQLTVLSGKEVIADLKENIFNNRIWPDFTQLPSPERPVMRFQEISTDHPMELRGYRIHATEVSHTVPAYGYLVENSSKGSLVYTGDTGPTEKIWSRMDGHHVRVLIVEASFPDELAELASVSGHMTPALLEKEIGKMPVIPDKIYVTHLKPFYKKKIQDQLRSVHGIDAEILEDGMVITL